jgi:Restriction endonuclease
MDGRTFEHFLVSLFRRLGYRVEHTGPARRLRR